MNIKIKTILYLLAMIGIWVFPSACSREGKPQEVISVYRKTAPPSNEQIQRDFDTLDPIFSNQKGFKSVQFLKAMDERAKYGYLVFGKWNNVEDLQNVFKKHSFKELDEKDLSTYRLIRESRANQTDWKGEHANYVLFFKISDARVRKDFEKTIEVVLDNLKTKKGHVSTKAYRSLHPDQDEYPYVVIDEYKGVEGYVEAFEEDVSISSIARNLPESVQMTAGLYQTIKAH